jgi:hypothetical protein
MESTGRVDNVREKRRRDDRVLPETRWLSAIIIPFLELIRKPVGKESDRSVESR